MRYHFLSSPINYIAFIHDSKSYHFCLAKFYYQEYDRLNLQYKLTNKRENSVTGRENAKIV